MKNICIQTVGVLVLAWSSLPAFVHAFQISNGAGHPLVEWRLESSHKRRSAFHVRSDLGVDFGSRGDSQLENPVVLDWAFLDGVYLITCPNVDPDGARLRQAKGILENVGLGDKVVVKEFEADDEYRIRGCYSSHVSVMKDLLGVSEREETQEAHSALLAHARDAVVMILEDNLAISGKPNQLIIDAVANYCQMNSTWDVIQMAYNPYVPDLIVSKTTSDRVVKLSCGVGSALGTTAYVINTKAMKTVIHEDKERGFYAPIPDVMAKLFPESRYASEPTIFVRCCKTKSLVNPQLDGLRSLLFQPAVTGFSQRLLALTGLSTNLLLLLSVCLLLCTSLLSGKLTFDAAFSLATTGEFDGPLLLPILSSAFTIFSLAVIAQGVILAPKSPCS